jgi:hypothetical protein
MVEIKMKILHNTENWLKKATFIERSLASRDYLIAVF